MPIAQHIGWGGGSSGKRSWNQRRRRAQDKQITGFISTRPSGRSPAVAITSPLSVLIGGRRRPDGSSGWR
jgi:hypothetical protein